MNVITRGDFDGLTCCVLLTEVHPVREIKFVHPKDAQDGKVTATADDIVCNVPFLKNCALWFDHHMSEASKLEPSQYKGRFQVAPSCARVIYDYYKTDYAAKLDRYTELLEYTDKLDSAALTMEEIERPEGWILLGLTIDPRSGLGPEFQKYFRWLVEFVKEVPKEKVLAHNEVKKRTDRVLAEQEEHRQVLKAHSKLVDNVIITDMRGVKNVPAGNRFLIYTLYPEANVEMRIIRGHEGRTVVAVGHSIFNRTCSVNIGDLMQEFGGGGHMGAGTCQLPAESAESGMKTIEDRLRMA